MVSIRRHSRWKGPLGPAEDPPLHLLPVGVEVPHGDEPVCFLRDIDLNQPPQIPRGRGRGRPRGRGRGRSRGRSRGGGSQLHGHYQRGRGRRLCQVSRSLVLRSDRATDAVTIFFLSWFSPRYSLHCCSPWMFIHFWLQRIK
jgi:hypothetical protein